MATVLSFFILTHSINRFAGSMGLETISEKSVMVERSRDEFGRMSIFIPDEDIPNDLLPMMPELISQGRGDFPEKAVRTMIRYYVVDDKEGASNFLREVCKTYSDAEFKKVMLAIVGLGGEALVSFCTDLRKRHRNINSPSEGV